MPPLRNVDFIIRAFEVFQSQSGEAVTLTVRFGVVLLAIQGPIPFAHQIYGTALQVIGGGASPSDEDAQFYFINSYPTVSVSAPDVSV